MQSPFLRRTTLAAISGGLLAASAAAAVAGAQTRAAIASPNATRAPAPPSPALDVIPFPGTPDASPTSQIILPALRPSAVRSVTVTGSHSGRHDGHITATAPGGAGTTFTPSHPFAPGEEVRVRVALRSRTAAAAAGDPRSTTLRFSFAVAFPAPPAPPATQATATQATAAQTRRAAPQQNWQVFHSQPHLHPPAVRLAADGDQAAGDIFLTPHNAGQTGPMIVNGHGQLVWFRPTGRSTAFNLEVQRYQGRKVLTWWQGHLTHGYGADGQDIILNSSYRTLAVLHAVDGYSSDLHEFQLMPHGRALIDAYHPVRASLASVGGPKDGVVVDNIIQELDVRTGRLLWEWHAMGHVPLSASYNWVPSDSFPFDYFHVNSIQPLPDGKLLISARNTWAVYLIDERTGRVVWTLGGKNPSFSMGSGTNFEWQHDARLHRRGILTLFDDAAVPEEERESSAKVMQINTRTGTVSLLHRYTHAPATLAGSQGNAQLLRSGNLFVGWGTSPHFSEYTPSGRQIFDGYFRTGVNTYRAYRFRWTGSPGTRPSLAVSPGANGGVRLYASWNGATQVAYWEALGGNTRQSLQSLEGVPADGFETTIGLQASFPYYAVEALSAQGQVLGRSYAIPNPVSGG